VDGWEAVAQAITDRMAERGLTQRELAERSGVSVATLREIQRGVRRRRSAVMLAAISRALGFPDGHLRDLMRSLRPEASSPDASDADLRARVADLELRVARLESEAGKGSGGHP